MTFPEADTFYSEVVNKLVRGINSWHNRVYEQVVRVGVLRRVERSRKMESLCPPLLLLMNRGKRWKRWFFSSLLNRKYKHSQIALSLVFKKKYDNQGNMFLPYFKTETDLNGGRKGNIFFSTIQSSTHPPTSAVPAQQDTLTAPSIIQCILMLHIPLLKHHGK